MWTAWSSSLPEPTSCKRRLMPAKLGASAAACKSTVIRLRSWSSPRLYAVRADQPSSLSPRDSRSPTLPPSRTSTNPTHSYTWASNLTQFLAWTRRSTLRKKSTGRTSQSQQWRRVYATKALFAVEPPGPPHESSFASGRPASSPSQRRTCATSPLPPRYK